MTPPTSRRDRKKAAVRARLYEAAWHLFVEKGFAETTVEEITDAADYAKGTFFNHFPTKEGVLQAYYAELVAESLANLEAILTRHSTVAHRLCAYLQQGAELVEAEGPRHRVLLERWLHSPRLLAQDGEIGATFRERYDRVFREGIACGELAPDLDVPACVAVFRSLWSSSLADWAMLGCEEGRLASMLDARLGVFLKGVLAR